MSAEDGTKVRRFGTWEGVFTPTLLTILGVVMFLREGWVVGELGLVGAWAVIVTASIITVCTAFSVSSIATNVRLSEGGPYAIVSRSLGSELGGSIGIPLFLSQALAVAMYVFGLREGWCWIFPSHPEWIVDGSAFLIVLLLTMASTTLAFRVQYVVLLCVILSLVSVALGLFDVAEPHPIEWWRRTSESFWDPSRFWVVFAVFFPATTGILAGANMSGELENPRRSIPLGTLSATAIATLIYLALAFWLATVASPEELRTNYTVMIDRALYSPLVIAGLLAATFSSALASFVGAPRILHALAADGSVPFSKVLQPVAKTGEPRRAALATASVVILGLALRDLNVIAPLITLFFLITYGMINLVVLFESRLAVVSFRPRLRLHWSVPTLGAVGALFAMFVINATFSLVALSVTMLIYAVLMRRKLGGPADDVRSGLFLMIAEWAARRASRYSKRRSRAWKANLLVPVVDFVHTRRAFDLIVDLAKPYGSITLLGVGHAKAPADLHTRLERLANDLMDAGVHTTAVELSVESVSRGVIHAMQTLRNAFLRPNIVFLAPTGEPETDAELEAIMRAAGDNRMGVVLAAIDLELGLGRRRDVHLWLREQSPDWNLEEGWRHANMNLQMLAAYLITARWDGDLTVHCATDETEHGAARTYIGKAMELARMPERSKVALSSPPFDAAVAATGEADIHIFGLPADGEIAFAHRMKAETAATCVFVRDSGEEDALV